MLYELRQYDTALLKFEVSKSGLDKLNYDVVWVNEAQRQLLPTGMTADGTGIEKWLKLRVIPKNRQYVDNILARSGLSHNDIMGVVNICKGLSLNDSYWVVEDGFNGKFANYNLYQNSFARTLALIAYTGYGSSGKRGFTSSPEYTTNGMLKKCWRRIDGRIMLYKGGTSGAANAGNEPYSEYYASQIADRMGLNHVTYGLAKWKGEICSTCPLFTDIDTSFVPMYRFGAGNTLEETAAFLKKLGDKYYQSFADMIVFDALICNTDRHMGNFGLLVDNHTNLPTDFAPLFDNGLSLFNYAMPDDLQNLDKYAETRFPAFDGVSFEDVVKAFKSDRQNAMLRRMINFSFKRHARYNLPKQRLAAIENYLQRRIKKLLDI